MKLKKLIIFSIGLLLIWENAFAMRKAAVLFGLTALLANAADSSEFSTYSKVSDEYEGNDDPKKVTICHFPPGNRANFHEITIGESAVPHHVKNHDDTIGPCDCAELCDDDNVCTEDLCDYKNGGCLHDRPQMRCEDCLDCTDDICDPKVGCTYTPNDKHCEAGYRCDEEEGCVEEGDL